MRGRKRKSPGGKIIRVQLAIIYEEIGKGNQKFFVSINLKEKRWARVDALKLSFGVIKQ
jgi:hypothetical protein